MNLLAVGERETRCALTHLSGLSVFREKKRERETPEADHSDEQIPKAFLPRTT